LLNTVPNQDYIERLKKVILHLHKVDSTWVETVPVHEEFEGQTVWQGNVEVFDLQNHVRAKRAYAWLHGAEGDEKFTAILEIRPVKDALTAVKVSILAESKKGWK
jgi:hypothetical protein